MQTSEKLKLMVDFLGKHYPEKGRQRESAIECLVLFLEENGDKLSLNNNT